MSYGCNVCGGRMIGDGLHSPLRCENYEVPEGAEPDSGPWYCENMPMVEPKARFLTGSSLVIGIEHSDRDIVCLFNSEDEVNVFADALGCDKKIYGDSKFLSVRNGALNYLCTADIEFFYRFKAYSGVLELLQIRDKDQRVKTAKACLYWDGPKS